MGLTRLYCLICLVVVVFSISSVNAQWKDGGIPICIDEAIQRDPQPVSDGEGGAIITWRDFRIGSPGISARRVLDYGYLCWSPNGVMICNPDRPAWWIQMCSDGMGGAIITWDIETYDIYAQRVNGNGSVMWIENGVPVCTAAGFNQLPVICSDGSGGAIIAWSDYRNGSSDADIYAQRIDAGGNVKWFADGIAVCTALDEILDNPKIVAGDAGGAIIVWDDHRGSDWSWNVYTQRIDSLGNTLWNSNGKVVANDTSSQFYSKAVTDGAGGAIIIYYNGNPDGSGLYAKRINSNGNSLWSTGPDQMDNGNSWNAQIDYDGYGGAVVGWVDYRSGIEDIYAQRINSNGNILWTVGGTPVCIDPGYQDWPQITADGLGGAIIIWNDYRNGYSEVYAQRINSSGDIEWTSNGMQIAAGQLTDPHYNKQITGDGAGGAIITWTNTDSGEDVYALKVDSSGNVLPTEVEEIPHAFTLMQNTPNPFNPMTSIKFDLPRAVHVKLCVYNVKGELIATLVNQHMIEGRKEINWTAKDNRGRPVSSGIYFYRLVAGDFVQTKKMVLLR